jgi:phosphatidylglycerol:prolipoprotein diacylglycerol transferase
VFPVLDPVAFGLPLGWMFGRCGCFVVKDHPGIPTDFFLGVENYYESGVTRHDLGFYEILWSIACVAVFFVLAQRRRRPGFYVALLPVLYTPVRFFLDYLRAGVSENGDIRYGGLTPGQYASAALLVVGVLLLIKIHASKEVAPLPQALALEALEPSRSKRSKSSRKKS